MIAYHHSEKHVSMECKGIWVVNMSLGQEAFIRENPLHRNPYLAVSLTQSMNKTYRCTFSKQQMLS